MNIVLNGDKFYFIKVGDLIIADTCLETIRKKAKEYRMYGKTLKIFKAIQSVCGFGIIRVLTEDEKNGISK